MADTSPADAVPAPRDAVGGAVARAKALIELFHADQQAFTGLEAVDAADMPEPYAGLLAHNSHMTVAMERYHGGPVSLRVVAERNVPGGEATDGAYAREILLANASGTIVQYGIVRIDLYPLPEASCDAILRKGEPLGRILIASGMHREVQAVDLLKLTPGPAFGGVMEAHGPTYGRVAEIRLDGRPAVELLEVVPSFQG